MMGFKDRGAEEDWDVLKEVNPYLAAILFYAGCRAEKYGLDILITSIFRQDGSIHNFWEGADCRLRHDNEGEMNLAHWQEITNDINAQFEFGGVRHDDVDTHVCHIRLAELGHHDDPMNDHVHFQARRH